MERQFQFRERMLQRHGYDLRGGVKAAGDVAVDESFIIAIARDAGRVIENAALDLQEYLRRSMDVSLAVKRYDDLAVIGRPAIVVAVCEDVTAVSGAAKVVCKEGSVALLGHDERGAAQAVYRFEDMMTLRRGPFVKALEQEFVPEFSPRMTHSGYGLDDYPDAHLAAIAHAGMDAILVFVKGMDMTPKGYLDFNTLIWRAAGYGLDVYAYSYFRSERNPEDPDAWEHYDSTYGKIFKNCPDLKGVVLVGESCAFPSKDPRVAGMIEPAFEDGIPVNKPRSGWFPCEDYPQWLSFLQKVIYTYNPNADIVFWTYNWGNAPEADRLKLIDNLPAGISLMTTFEMYQDYDVDGIPACATDYTIRHAEYGDYFRSEGELAKKKGIRFYTQANAAGLEWDFGVIPYDPFPAQWNKRYDSLLEAKKKFGLCGVMECHHYGFYPSFISAMETMRFQEGLTGEEAMARQAQILYGEFADEGLEAWKWLDEALQHHFSSNEDQYGPSRIGPAYPFIYQNSVEIPSEPYAHAGGNTYCWPDYGGELLFYHTHHTMGASGMQQFRIDGEVKSLEQCRWCLNKAIVCLTALEAKLDGWQKDECGRLCNMVKFIDCTILTTIHAKLWHQCRWEIRAEKDAKKVMERFERMIAIGREEIANAEDAIELLEYDSRIGWEPNMEYNGGVRNVKWKIRQVKSVIENEIPSVMAHVQKYLDR